MSRTSSCARSSARPNRSATCSKSYLAKYREATARDNIGASSPEARIISRGIVSNTPSWPKKLPTVLIAALGMFTLAVGFILTGQLMSGPMPASAYAPVARSFEPAAPVAAPPAAVPARQRASRRCRRSPPPPCCTAAWRRPPLVRGNCAGREASEPAEPASRSAAPSAPGRSMARGVVPDCQATTTGNVGGARAAAEAAAVGGHAAPRCGRWCAGRCDRGAGRGARNGGRFRAPRRDGRRPAQHGHDARGDFAGAGAGEAGPDGAGRSGAGVAQPVGDRERPESARA